MKQENINHNEKKNQSIKTDPEMAQMVELVDNDNKVALINISQMVKKVHMAYIKNPAFRDENGNILDDKFT